jgi:hypothetical protein
VADLLPTFFVIGAPKCGTTSLHFYLDQHPEIAMTTDKEPNVFAREDYRDRLDRYEELFAVRAAVRGESSVIYSEHPCWQGVPTRIRVQVPEARFIYVVGDPVERVIRHYAQLVIDGKASGRLDDALADYEQDYNGLACGSRYATQVRQYLDHFDASRILIVDQRDLLEAREPTLSRVFAFLGVDASFRSPAFEQVRNTQVQRRTPRPLGRLAASPPLAPLKRVSYPAAIRRRIRRHTSTPVPRPRLDPALRARFAESLREETAWLREFSGLRFETWPV